MTDLRRSSLFQGLFAPHPEATADLSVETLSHAARYMFDCPPSADVVVLESADALAPYLRQIDSLAEASTDTNTQFESVTLAAAMEHLQNGTSVNVALVWSPAASDGRRLLLGLFPYRAQRGRYGLPVPIWSIWEHIHSYVMTPLVRTGHERQAIRRFLAYADQAGAAAIRFPMFEAGGAFDAALEAVLAEQGREAREIDRHERALMQSDLDEDAYLSTHIRKKKRKEFSRLWNRLGDLGDVAFTTHDGGADAAGWVQTFLTLEASGWKGERGTAMKKRPSERKWFETICAGAKAQGKLHCSELTLNGKSVAMLTSFRAGDGLYTFKIAFDEAYAKYSPGSLLMLKLTGAGLRDENVEWIDSCAIPDHPMIDHIWAQRRTMRDVAVAARHPLGVAAISWLAAGVRFEAYARARARSALIGMRKRKEKEADND